MIRLLQALPPPWRQTLTLDNGVAFRLHEQVRQATGIPICFAHPCAACERGHNEHTNGLTRQYLPQSTGSRYISPQKLQEIIHGTEQPTQEKTRLPYAPRGLPAKCCT
jgi:IS30 family transposase